MTASTQETPAFAQRRHWSLAVLGLLRERPMHPYEMRRLMRQRHKDDRLVLKPGSLYNAVAWLVEQHLVEAVGTASEGSRPQRTTYRILPAGERELTRWIGAMLQEIRRDVSSFSVALDHLVHLAPDDAAAHLDARRSSLDHCIAQLERTLETLSPRVARINLLEVEYDLALFRAQREWIRELGGRLRNGRLCWKTKDVLARVRAADEGTAAGSPATVRSAPARKVRRSRRPRAAN